MSSSWYSDRLWKGRPGFDSQQCRISVFSAVLRLAVGPTHAPVSPGGKWHVREARHSPPSSAEVYPHSPICLHGIVPSYLNTGTTLPLLLHSITSQCPPQSKAVFIHCSITLTSADCRHEAACRAPRSERRMEQELDRAARAESWVPGQGPTHPSDSLEWPVGPREMHGVHESPSCSSRSTPFIVG